MKRQNTPSGARVFKPGEMIGERKVLRRVGRDTHGNILWEVLCRCEERQVVRAHTLRRTRACGSCSAQERGERQVAANDARRAA